MNTTFLIALLITGALGTSIGWFLSAVMLSRSLRDDLAVIDAERQELEDDRKALLEFTRAQVEQENRRISWDLKGHRRLTREVQ